MEKIKSDQKRGLTTAEAAASQTKYGKNIITEKKKISIWRRFFRNMGDPVIKILLAALAVNLLFTIRGGDWVECLGIAISVFLATFISTMSESRSESAFARLGEIAGRENIRTRRDGIITNISIDELAVGDIIFLSAGDKVPADGIILEGKLTLDQSPMTGESREVEKTPSGVDALNPENRSAVLRGCAVMSGEGTVSVRAVGDATFLGEISREVQEEKRDSPLKIRLKDLAKQISRLGYIMAAMISLAYLFNILVLDSGFRWEVISLKLSDLKFMVETLLHALTLGLTVIVVAVPEGLPMMIAVVLSANIRKMVRDKVLVRKPAGIEAAGSMNILFTDKTGTLTEGKMTVGEIYLGDGSRFSSVGGLKGKADYILERFNLSATFNSSAVRSKRGIVGGNFTDRALLSSAGEVKKKLREVAKMPFDSKRKYSAVKLVGEEMVTLVKGAPDILLSYVKKVFLADGARVGADIPSISAKLKKINSEGKRVLLLAEGQGGICPRDFGELTLICLVVLDDKLRREAPTAVNALRGAGVHVVMITGDSRETAAAIGRASGILGDGVDLCLTGKELSVMSDMKLREILPRLGVVARALPTDKSRLVRIAQEAELVVGMTGDGINDAPALKRADVGFAMGCGTQVAKEAGDIIILDNNLASIVRALLYGRNIFKSIRKFITLQLTMNFCAVGVSMIGPFIGVDAPVTVVQMLWINIIMDTLGGLAFAGEAADRSCMSEKPKKRNEPILNRYMINRIIFLGGLTVALCITFLKSPRIASLFRPATDNIYLMTAFFALFIFASVFNCFNARTDRLNLLAGLRKNPVFLFIMCAILVIQLVFVYLGGSVLRTAPLTARELLVTMSLSLSVFPVEMIRKLLWRLRGKRGGY